METLKQEKELFISFIISKKVVEENWNMKLSIKKAPK